MRTTWTLEASSFSDQLDDAARGRISAAIGQLERGDLPPALLVPMHSQPGLYRLRVGPDIRILFSRTPDGIRIVDIVKRSQIDHLRKSVG